MCTQSQENCGPTVYTESRKQRSKCVQRVKKTAVQLFTQSQENNGPTVCTQSRKQRSKCLHRVKETAVQIFTQSQGNGGPTVHTERCVGCTQSQGTAVQLCTQSTERCVGCTQSHGNSGPNVYTESRKRRSNCAHNQPNVVSDVHRVMETAVSVCTQCQRMTVPVYTHNQLNVVSGVHRVVTETAFEV